MEKKGEISKNVAFSLIFGHFYCFALRRGLNVGVLSIATAASESAACCFLVATAAP